MAGSGWLALRTMPGPGWVRGSGPAVLRRLRDAAVVRPGFLSAAEEETLRRELEPELRRRRYEFDHWDAVRPAALEAGPRWGRSHVRGGGRDVGGGDGRGALVGGATWDGALGRGYGGDERGALVGRGYLGAVPRTGLWGRGYGEDGSVALGGAGLRLGAEPWESEDEARAWRQDLEPKGVWGTGLRLGREGCGGR